jgi:hypothetical protein
MAKKIPTWLKVCGIGCGTLVLLVAGLIAGSFFFFRGAIRDFGEADRAMEGVVERYGPIAEFRADRSGAIPPSRIEAFLFTRDAVREARSEAERSLVALSEGPDQGGALRKLWAGSRVLGQLAEFQRQRHEALLDAEMGLGEYYYIYTIAYYSWLGKSPADGPSFELVGDNGYVLQTAFEGLDEAQVREHRAGMARGSLNRLLLPVLHAQLSDLTASGGLDHGGRWEEALRLEIANLEADHQRIPWEDGLPENAGASLLPYQERLEQSYSPMCNALEIGVARR